MALLSLFEAIRRVGDQPALVTFETGKKQSLSGEECADAIDAEAAELIEKYQAGPDRRIAVFAAPSRRAVIASLAVLRSGATLVPVDTQFADETLTSVLDDADLSGAYCDARRCSRLSALKPALPRLPVEALSLRKGGNGALPSFPSGHSAALFYTSGTTGAPKGVPLSERNLAYQFDVLRDSGVVGPGDRLLLPLPLHHVYPLVIGLLAPLALGLTVVLPRSLTGRDVLRAAAESEATIMVGVPRLYRALLEGLERRGGAFFKVADVICYRIRSTFGASAGRLLLAPMHRQIGPQLRLFASGGAPLQAETALRLEGLGWEVAIGYGLTETSPLLTINREHSPHPQSVGAAVSGTELRLIEGELQARGPGVFAGYRNLPEKTQEVFTAGGWFRTGDLAQIDSEGFVYITGRASTVLVTEGGKNIQPDEVEVAYEVHPEIREIAVLQEENRLVAIVVPEPSTLREGDSETQVRKAINSISGQLPSYQRIADFAITHEPLPRTRLGKLRRHLLRERYQKAREGVTEPAPGPMSPEDMSEADVALLEDERARQVWDLLAERYKDRRLTPDANPQLDLGIDSMEWLDLGLEISRLTGVELEESQTSEIGSVRDLLQLVTESKSAAAEPGWPGEIQRVLTRRDQRWLRPLSPPGSTLAGSLHRLDRILATRWFELSIKGAPPPADTQVLFAPNHISHLDPFILAAALEPEQMRRTFWAGWTGAAFRNPFTRAIARLGQAIPVDQRSARASLALAEAVLKRGYNLVWFPEGARSRNGQMQPFRKGVGHLLDDYPVTVVPVTLRGTYEAMPPGRRLPRRRPVSLRFGPAIEPEQLDREGDGEQRPERLTQALQRRMETLLQEA